MRIRDRMTYANVMATIAVFGVVASGGAYAASKIDTPDIANNAITAKKLDSQAVKASKLRPGAVTSAALADGAVQTGNLSKNATLAMAGVVVYDGEVRGWFNRFSDGQPTLEHPQPGVYNLRIPGIDGTSFSSVNLVNSVSLIGTNVSPPGEISSSWRPCDSGGGCLFPIIYTFDSSGDPTDRSFTYLVYRADHGV